MHLGLYINYRLVHQDLSYLSQFQGRGAMVGAWVNTGLVLLAQNLYSFS